MTNEEVIKQLSNVTIYHQGKCTREALDIAISAIKKQIPRKPNFKREQTSPFGVDDVPYCPTCNCSVSWIETNVFYCESCGQAIDWSVSE